MGDCDKGEGCKADDCRIKYLSEDIAIKSTHDLDYHVKYVETGLIPVAHASTVLQGHRSKCLRHAMGIPARHQRLLRNGRACRRVSRRSSDIQSRPFAGASTGRVFERPGSG